MQFFEKDSVSEVINNKLVTDSFNNLPLDRFLVNNDTFRKRRYGTGKVRAGIATWDYKVTDFQQEAQNNSYVGDARRKFEPIDFSMQEMIAQKIILRVLNKHLPAGDYSFGVHQIRITASDEAMGKPAPEGPHQDGFDYLSITCVHAHNVAGGNSLVVAIDDSSRIFYDDILTSGDTLIINDRKLAHYASPIVPKLPGTAYRDVIVVTYSLLSGK